MCRVLFWCRALVVFMLLYSRNTTSHRKISKKRELATCFTLVFSLAYSSTLKMEAIYSFETSVYFQRTLWHSKLFITTAVRTSNTTSLFNLVTCLFCILSTFLHLMLWFKACARFELLMLTTEKHAVLIPMYKNENFFVHFSLACTCYRGFLPFFSLLSLFWKKWKYSYEIIMLSLNSSLYETLYVYHVIWSHLNGVLQKSLPSVCASVCVSSYRC
jgi:hypothetical protein